MSAAPLYLDPERFFPADRQVRAIANYFHAIGRHAFCENSIAHVFAENDHSRGVA